MSALVKRHHFGGRALVYLPRYVSPDDPHQFRNPEDATEPFGFLCIVNAERDRPQAVDGLGACHICE